MHKMHKDLDGVVIKSRKSFTVSDSTRYFSTAILMTIVGQHGTFLEQEKGVVCGGGGGGGGGEEEGGGQGCQ